MLGMKEYPKSYVQKCRSHIEADVQAFSQVEAHASPELRRRFYNALVLALDYMFVHRLRGVEGKDGNPLNEVGALCESILKHDGRFVIPKNIKLTPETSILGLEEDEDVELDQDAFLQVAGAFFDEIEAKFT